jgi:hypothetical protein
MFPRLARGSCKYVRGIIAADYTCNEFSPRNKAEGATPPATPGS